MACCIVTKLCEGHRVLEEFFGPLISIEVLEAKNDFQNYEHLYGDPIYQQVKETNFTEEEVKLILDDNPGSDDLFIFTFVGALDILTSALTGPTEHLIRIGQFKRFGRVLNIEIDNRRFSYIISSPLLEFDSNEEMFNKFCFCLIKYLRNKHSRRLIPSYIYVLIPAFLRRYADEFSDVLRKIGSQRIENKPVNAGIIFVDNYENFKKGFYEDLFWDLESGLSLYNFSKIKQPLFEVVDGKKGFLVVDKNFHICGLMYTDLIPKGILFNDDYAKNIDSDCLVVSLSGSASIKVIRYGKLIFEILDGLIRVRDYGTLGSVLKEGAFTHSCKFLVHV